MKKFIFLILFLLLIVLNVQAKPPSPFFPYTIGNNTFEIVVIDGDTVFVGDGGLSYTKFYNVKRFGAVGDSSADDRSAILSAIDAYRNDADGNGAVIYFPSGVYRLSDSIQIPIDTLEGLSIVGEGLSTRIYLEGTGGFYVYDTTATGKTGIAISGLRIENLASNTTAQYGIHIYKTGLVKIQDVSIYGGGYLDKAIFIHGSQQGYIEGGYLYQCVEGLVFDNSTSGDIHSNGIHVSGVTITCTSTGNEYTRGVRYSGSNTGVFIGNHITNCSTLVKVDTGQQALQLLGNHLETGDIGFEIDGSSNTNISGNSVYDCNKSLYLKRGNTHHVSNNLFNDSVVVGASSATNDFVFNLFSAPFVDSIEISGDSSNYNSFFGNKNQGTGNAPSSLRYTTKTTDSLDLYIYTTAGPFTGRMVGTDSAYLEIKGIGADVPYGFRFSKYGEISYNTNTSNGMRFYTNDSSGTLTQRLKIAGAVNKPLITFSDISGLKIGEYTLDTTDGTDGQVLTTDGLGNVQFENLPAGVGETNTLADSGTFNGTEGFGLAQTKVGTELRIRGLIEGTNITLGYSGDTAIVITASGGSGELSRIGVTDTLVFTTYDTNDSFKVYYDGTKWVFGTATGATYMDTALSPVFCIEMQGDTICFDTTTGTSPLTNGYAWVYNSATQNFRLTDLSATYELQLNNEAGLYSALSDVTNFLQTGDALAGGDITANSIDTNKVVHASFGKMIRDTITAEGYITGNETITLSGDASGSGTTSITVTVADDSHTHDTRYYTKTESNTIFQPIGHGDADSLKGVPIPNTPTGTGDDGKVLAFFDEAIDTLGWLDLSSTFLRLIGGSLSGKLVADGYRADSTNADSQYTTKGYADSVLTNIENPNFIGDLRITGSIDQWNLKYDLDTANIKFYHADAPLDIPIPSSNMVPANSGADSLQIIHPSVVYIPYGWNGYKYWFVGTPYPSSGSSAYEDICLFASNDNKTWDSSIVSNPLFDEADIAGATYISDGSIFYTDIGQLGIVFRTTHDAVIDTFKLWVSLSSNGTTWSTPVNIANEIAGDVIVGTDTATAIGHPLISPDIWLDTTGQYKMTVINTNSWLSVSGVDTTLHNVLNSIELWESVSPDSGWSYIDTISFTPLEPVYPKYRKTVLGGSGTDTTHYEPWHQSILHYGADLDVMFLTATPVGGSGGDARLYIGISNDGANSFTFRNVPILASEGMPQAWDDDYIYRASGIKIQKGDRYGIGLYYSAFGYSASLGTGKERGTGYTESFWGDSVQQTALVYFNKTYGRGYVSSDSVTLTHPTAQGWSLYEWIDSCYDNSTTVYDTIFMTAEIPYYMRAESLIIAGIVSNASTSGIDAYLLYAYTAIGSTNDTGTTGGTNVPNANWLSGGGLRSSGTLNFNNTSLTREAFYIGTSDSSTVFRGGERIAIRLLTKYTAVNQTVKCGYVMIKGNYLEDNIAEDRNDRRKWYK